MQFKFWLSTFVKPSPQSSEWTCPSCPQVFSRPFPSLSFLTPSLPKTPVSVDCAVCAELLQSCPALCNRVDSSSLCFSVHGDSPGENTGVDCVACSRGSSQLGIGPAFPVIPSLQADSLPLSYRGSPCHYRYTVTNLIDRLCLTLCDAMDYTIHGILQARILEWVAFPFSRGSSQHRDQTQASRIAGRFFTCWATREAHHYISVANEVAQSCPTLCDPVDCSLSGSSVHGILQARLLERVAIPFCRGSSHPRDQT